MAAVGLPAIDGSFAPKKRSATTAHLGEGGNAPAAKRSAAETAAAQLRRELPDNITEEEIQRRLDQADDVHIEVFNEASLKRMVMQLERKIKVNQEMRIKFSEEPEKFFKSEGDLDEEVKKLTTLATHPDLYGEFVHLGALPVLVGLLNHANTDIAVDVFEVLSELTDPEVMGEVEEAEKFVEGLFQAQLCQLSVDVLLRIDENASEEDAQAVTNCLSMIENLAEVSPAETSNQFGAIAKFLPWLIKRVRAQGDVDYNRVYASEVLGIILQSSASSRESMVRLDGVDKLLRGIAPYRKKDPADSEESEFVQNMFDSLCSLMLLPAHQVSFGQVQGLELMIRMMRENVFASSLALRLTDHALRHCAANCQIFVDKLGLKVIFGMFMKKGPKQKTRSAAREMEEHVTSIIQSLCRYCTGTEVARVLNKFTENHFEKVERLLEMHEEYTQSVREADEARIKGQVEKIDQELDVDNEEQLFLDRCDAGLFTLQQIDVILVRLANMGNVQAAEEIGRLMDAKGVPLTEVCATIEEYCTHLDESAGAERGELRKALRVLVRRCGGDVGTLCPEPPEAAREGAAQVPAAAAAEPATKPGAQEASAATVDSREAQRSKEDPRKAESKLRKNEKAEGKEKKEKRAGGRDKPEKKEKRPHRDRSDSDQRD